MMLTDLDDTRECSTWNNPGGIIVVRIPTALDVRVGWNLFHCKLPCQNTYSVYYKQENKNMQGMQFMDDFLTEKKVFRNNINNEL